MPVLTSHHENLVVTTWCSWWKWRVLELPVTVPIKQHKICLGFLALILTIDDFSACTGDLWLITVSEIRASIAFNQALVESGQLDIVFVSRRFATHPRGFVSCEGTSEKPRLFELEDNQSYDSTENKATTTKALPRPWNYVPTKMHNDPPSPIEMWSTDVKALTT